MNGVSIPLENMNSLRTGTIMSDTSVQKPIVDVWGGTPKNTELSSGEWAPYSTCFPQ